MKFFPGILLWGYVCFTLNAQQQDYYSVVAEPGDGIFSLLRKQGLDPMQHYAEFVELNKGNLRNGSQLRLGESYKVPYSEDSFKRTAVQVNLSSGAETPIFDKELSKINLKSNVLKDAVYYLLIEDQAIEKQLALATMVKKLASELMVHGAQVYLFDTLQTGRTQDSLAHISTNELGQCVDAINKRYLKHGKKYQRVLLLRANNFEKGGKMNLALYHYQKSEAGQRFADNIQEMFKNRGTKKAESAIFNDKNSLFLATNLLPAVTLLTLDKGPASTDGQQLPVKVDDKRFAQLLSNGMMKDYAELDIED